MMQKKFGNILQDEFDDFWNTNILREEVLNKDRKFFVAKSEDGEILGFAGVLINFDFIEIMNIVVKKKYRKKGIGKELLEKIIDFSIEENFDIIDLEVNSKNEPAINLYRKFGFKEVGLRRKYYNNIDDAILMEKNIKKC